MRIRKLLLALVLLLTLTGYSAEGNISTNPRQGLAPISAEFRPELTDREPRSHLGFPLRFLEILVRNGFRWRDPYGLFRFSGVDAKKNRLILLVINRIQNKISGLFKGPDFCSKLELIKKAGWKDEGDFASTFLYGTEPEVKFKKGILGSRPSGENALGLDDPKLGTMIEGDLLDSSNLPFWDRVMTILGDESPQVDVIADTLIHEISHWKQRTSGANNEIQGWNFMTEMFLGQWTFEKWQKTFKIETSPK